MFLWKGQQYPKIPAHVDFQYMVTFQHILQHFVHELSITKNGVAY